MNKRGFTLVELMVVIAIITILLSITTLDFNSYMKKYQTERQTRELYSDIMELRLSAIQRKQRCAMFFGPRQFNTKNYASDNEDVIAGGVTVGTKNLNYEIKRGTGLADFDIAADHIEFDSRGLATAPMTIVVLPVQYNAGDNCILVTEAKTNIGRMIDAVTCRAR